MIRLRCISLGPACMVKYNIDKHLAEYQTTNFFDWVLCDFISVLQVLNNQKKFLLQDIHKISCWNDGKNNLTSRIKFTQYNYLHSIHDLPEHPSDRDYTEFISKYNRRFERLLKIINDSKRYYFIHYGYISSDLCCKFFEIINKINPNNDIYLVSTYVDYKQNFMHKIDKKMKTVHYNFTNDPVISHSVCWKLDGLDWAGLFRYLEKV